MFWRLLSWLLRRWAERSSVTALEIEREDHRATRQELAQAKSKIALQSGEIEALTAWQSKELSRLEWENAIFRGRKILTDDQSDERPIS